MEDLLTYLYNEYSKARLQKCDIVSEQCQALLKVPADHEAFDKLQREFDTMTGRVQALKDVLDKILKK